MNPLEAKIFAAQLNQDLPALDLHGLRVGEALEKIELFLYNNHQNNIDLSRVIYGGGSGKLKSEVLEMLHKHPLVDKIQDEGGSAIIISN